MKKIKEIIVIMLYILTGQLLLAIPVAAQPSDIQDHWAGKQVGQWINKGLIYGYEDDTFRPDNDITRAEFIAIVNRAFGFTEKGTIGFSDVPSDAWFAGEIAKAKAAGYLSGYNDGSVKPDNFINRTEAAVILSILLELNADEHPDSVKVFKDAPEIPQWGKGYFGVLVAEKYLQGYPDNTVRPLKNISRAEAVFLLSRALGDIDNTDTFSSVTKTITIGGMSCNMCVDKVTKALAVLDGVQVVSVEIGAAVISLSKDVSDEALAAAIENLGYSVISIQ